jgi:hypothetical protein
VTREFRPLLAIQDNFPKKVLSLTPLATGKEGVEHQLIYDFLTEN